MPAPPVSPPPVCAAEPPRPRSGFDPVPPFVRFRPAGPAPAFSRVAIGTYRVWLSEDVGVAAPNTWRVLRSISGQPVAPPGPGFSVVQATGMANPTRGEIRTMKWASPTVLLVVHRMAVVLSLIHLSEPTQPY